MEYDRLSLMCFLSQTLLLDKNANTLSYSIFKGYVYLEGFVC